MDALRFIERIKRSPDYHGQIVHAESLAARGAEYGTLDAPLPDVLANALAAQRITGLYRHQAEAIDLARSGFHWIITTPTASGKSLSYNAPVLETLLSDDNARALYLFPTKALAQDQRGKIDVLKLPGIMTATYDGDTPKEERGWVKRMGRDRDHQPRHASRRRTPLPHRLGNVFSEPALRRP